MHKQLKTGVFSIIAPPLAVNARYEATRDQEWTWPSPLQGSVLWMRTPTFQTLVDVFTCACCATTPAIIVPDAHLSCDAQVGLDVGDHCT